MASIVLRSFLLASIVLAWSGAPLRAADIQMLQTEDLIVYFEPPSVAVAREVMELYPEVRSSLENSVGWGVQSRPSIFLVGDSAQFMQMSESPLTVAFAVPMKNAMVVDHSRVNRKPLSLANTVKHELCHLLLHQHIREGTLPRWLDEGVCQWVSDGIPDILVTQKRSVLNRVALRGRFIPLRALTHAFPTQDQGLILAYEQSKSFVSHVIHGHGWQAVQGVLGQMAEGLDVHAAFEEVLGTPLDELERQWQESLRRRTSWFTYLSYYLYEVLFLVAGFLAMIGFVKVMIRRRRMLRDYEDEEGPLEDEV